MSKFLRFSPGVVPDTFIRSGLIHVVWGQAPMEWVILSPAGDIVERHAQPVGYFPKTNGQITIAHDGAKFLEWGLWWGVTPGQGKPIGNNPTAITYSGAKFYQRGGDTTYPIGVYCGTVRVNDYKPTGIWEAYEDGSCRMMDDCNRTEPWSGGYVHHAPSGALVVSERDSGGVVGRANGLPFLLWDGEDARWPRCSTDGTLASVVCWDANGPSVKVWIGTLDELASYRPPAPPPPTPPPPPPPPPVPEPEEPPVLPAWELTELMRAYVEKYPLPVRVDGESEDSATARCRAWTQRFAEQAAYSFPSGGYGCKRAGEGRPQSSDVLAALRGNTLYGWDLIYSAGTEYAEVVGQPATMNITGQIYMPVTPTNHLPAPEPPPVDPPPVDPPIPPPDDTLVSRVEYLERVTTHILTHLRAI